MKFIFDFLKNDFQEVSNSLDLSFNDDSVADEKKANYYKVTGEANYCKVTSETFFVNYSSKFHFLGFSNAF